MMNVLEFTLFVWLGGLVAGFLGALTGLGGGVVIVPLLTAAFGVGMFLEIATTVGALTGAVVAVIVSANAIAVIFGLVLITSALLSTRHRADKDTTGPPDKLAVRLRLDASYPTPTGPRHYHVQRVPLGFGLMYLAGILAGLLGIGSGAFKV